MAPARHRGTLARASAASRCRRRPWEHSFRPELLLTSLACIRPARGTRCWSRRARSSQKPVLTETRRRSHAMNREEALDVALGQIERQFGKGSVMRMSDAAQVSIGAVSTGSLSLDLALGIGGLATRTRRRDLRARVVGQDDARLPRDRGGAAAGRHLRVHRRGARDGPVLRAAHRRQHRRPARLAAGHGRAGARDLRAADPLRRARRRRRRLRRRADAEGGDRRGDGRQPRRACRRD